MLEIEVIQKLKRRASDMLDNCCSMPITEEEIYTIICEWERTYQELEKVRGLKGE